MNNSETVRAYLSCWGKRDMDGARKLLADECTFTDPSLGESLQADDFFAKTEAFVETIRSVEIVSVLEDDEFVGALYCLTTEQFPKFWFSEWFKVENGKIKEGRLLYDTHPLWVAWRKKNKK